jgi:hypothetical protein
MLARRAPRRSRQTLLRRCGGSPPIASLHRHYELERLGKEQLLTPLPFARADAASAPTLPACVALPVTARPEHALPPGA